MWFYDASILQISDKTFIIPQWYVCQSQRAIHGHVPCDKLDYSMVLFHGLRKTSPATPKCIELCLYPKLKMRRIDYECTDVAGKGYGNIFFYLKALTYYLKALTY
jgi:hypothetical protein